MSGMGGYGVNVIKKHLFDERAAPMNSLVQQQFPILDQTLALRHQLLEVITDDDLSYKLPGANPTLGALCRELTEVEGAYIDSFTTLKLDHSFRHADCETLESSVDALKSRFSEQEEKLKATVAEIPEEDLHNKVVERQFFSLPMMLNFVVYREALLIFYAKVVVYLRAMEKPIPPQVQGWIG